MQHVYHTDVMQFRKFRRRLQLIKSQRLIKLHVMTLKLSYLRSLGSVPQVGSQKLYPINQSSFFEEV